MSIHYWPDQPERLYEPAGGRCLCDECCAARPERLIERAEVIKLRSATLWMERKQKAKPIRNKRGHFVRSK